MSKHHRRLNPARWNRVRRKVLDAASFRCAVCGRYGNEVDHVVPLDKGGDPYDSGNLQVLCKEHHIDKTRRENETWTSPEREAWRDFVKGLSKSM